MDRRQQELMRTLWVRGRMSRWELHKHTGLTPNAVGTLVEKMLRARLLRECPPAPSTLGRPRVPLKIDPASRHVLGLALLPGRVEVCRVGLSGELIGQPVCRPVANPSRLVTTAATLLARQMSTDTLAIGITSPGFIDPDHRTILFSAALPGRGVEKLSPIFRAAGKTAAVFGNDMHALAARWLLTHRAEQQQDVLLVWFADGRLGSALLIDGRPNRGCATGGNELGHTRFPGIKTGRCYCGAVGCLERIVSSDFLRREARPAKHRRPIDLDARVAQFTSSSKDPPLEHLLDLLAQSLSNAINFLRPHRLVLASPYTRHTPFIKGLTARTRALVLPDLAIRVNIDLWEQASTGSAENASWQAIAELIYSGWDTARPNGIVRCDGGGRRTATTHS